MELQLYVNNSDNAYLNKALEAVGSPLTCAFKDNTNMESPELVLSSVSADQRANIMRSNYAYISDFSRYYYIEEKTVSQQRVILSLRCDVLMSHASGILNCKCIALRSSNDYNAYLNDNQYSRLQYGKPVIKKFSTGFSKANKFILTIAGGV